MYSLPSRTLWIVSLGLIGLACSKSKVEDSATSEPSEPAAAAEPAAVPAAPPSPAAQAKQLFESKCTACHGSSGLGDGPGAQALDPKPRNFSDKAWQAATTDEQIRKIIEGGGPSVGKSPGMPGNPDLSGKDDVLRELVKIVRGFGA